MSGGRRRRVLSWPIAVAAVFGVLASLVLAAPAQAALAGADPILTRAPYLTDLTAGSVTVSWATATQTKGVVKYGASGSCTAASLASPTLGSPITVGSTTQYQNKVTLTGLSAGTAYCYRVYTGDAAATDLLGSLPAGTVTTLAAPGDSGPVSFAVLGDWGDTTNGATNTGAVNTNQANVMSRLASSGARFAVSVGDIGYPGGTQTTYGDVNQTGVNVSAVFGPQYWTVPGSTLPLYVVNGNHGRNTTMLLNWPSSAVASASNGVFASTSYPAINGTTAASYPTTYYAFTTAGTRLYLLDATWSESNVGNATGGACGSHCQQYEVDAAAHWTTSSAEYAWLAGDLAAHSGERKMAFFHYPLRSDDNNQPSDVYLQNTPGSSGSLEQLLASNGVRLIFNGHSHTYQRFVPPPGGVASYVTGGGGAKATTVGDKGCSSTNAYSVGWTYSSNKGKKCGAAALPTSDAQVYHFLKVTVNGSQATVTPTDSAGNTFDPATYELGPDGAAPSAPGALAATQPTSASVKLTWTAASDNAAVVAYDVYRNGAPLTTLLPGVLTYTDTTAVAGTTYTYRVDARDLAGNVGTASVSNGTAPDTTPPTAPGALTATATSATSVALTWTASTDAVGVTGYTVRRGGAVVGSVSGTTLAWTDPGVAASTTYAYTVTASDAAGNVSPASPTASVTTPATPPPPAVIFEDTFESGGLGAWTAVSGLTTDSSGAHAGTWSAREASTGTATYASKTLPSTYNELWAQSWVYITSRSTSVNLIGFNKATSASIVVLYVDTLGRVSLRNNQGLVTTYSTVTVAPGAWHRFGLHALVNGTSSTIEATLDGAPVPGLTLTGQNLGTTPIGRFTLGETGTGRTY
ncbi:MAG: fibronectin type III domain-containing protein, partial [Kineosporiaceae bacterium]